MANAISPNGFTVMDSVTSNQAYQTHTYCIPAADALQYQIGDAVKIAAGADANGYSYVQKAAGTASEYVRGVIVGCYPTNNVGTPSLIGTPLALETINIPATKTHDYYVEVNDDPNTIYEIQDDGLTALTATNANNNAYYTVANPTAPLQVSATVLTTGTVGTGATLPLRMLGLSVRNAPGGGNTFGKYAVWRVKFNFHDLNSAGVAGV